MGSTNKKLCLERNQMIYFYGLLQKYKQPQKQTPIKWPTINLI
jgi:hypothetical protein